MTTARSQRASRATAYENGGRLLRAYARDRDPALLERLVRRFLPLVGRIVAGFAQRGEPLEDLHQVGNLGLITALHRYDPARRRPFVAFAEPTIRGELHRHFRDRVRPVRLSRRAFELEARVRRTREELARIVPGEPTRIAIADHAALTIRDVREAEVAHRYGELLPLTDAIVGNDLGRASTGIVAVETRLLLRQLTAVLTARDRLIVLLRHRWDLLQVEIARIVGVSQVEVSRALRRAYDRFASLLTAPGPDG